MKKYENDNFIEDQNMDGVDPEYDAAYGVDYDSEGDVAYGSDYNPEGGDATYGSDYDSEYDTTYSSDYNPEGDSAFASEYADGTEYADETGYGPEEAGLEEIEPDAEEEPYYDRKAFKWLRTENRAKFIKLVSMLILSTAVLIFASIAWFTMNKAVGTSGMGVKTAGMPFELEVRGNFIENSDIMTVDTMFTDEFKNGIQQEDGEGNLVNIYRTGANNEKIVWRKNASSTAYPQGLSPDSSGELSFYVIPNQTGVLNVNFDFKIRGYHAVYEGETLTELVEITDSLSDSPENAAIGITSAETKKKALKYINGHILFFKGYDSNTGKYYDFCGRDSIAFNDFIEGNDKTVIQGQAYPVTVYWKWVNDFGDMFLPSTSPYVSAPLFADLNTDDRELIFEYLEDEDVYMFSGMTESAISSALTDIQNSSSATFRTSLTSLTTGYDNADLDIGNNIKYILFDMTASMVD